MSKLILHEAKRRNVVLSKTVDTSLLWENTKLTVLTDKGLEIFEFSHNVTNFTKNMDFITLYLPCPKVTPCTTIFPRNFIRNEMSNQDFNRCLLDPNLWSHDENYAKDVTIVYMYEWSQFDVIENTELILAILTNNGAIELFKKNRLGFTSVLRLTDIIEQDFISKNKTKTEFNSVEQLSNACSEILSSCFCWGPRKSITSDYFVTAQRNGDIIFWSLEHEQNNHISAKSIGNIHTDNEVIVKMMWIPQKSNNFILICSFVNGKIYAYICTICKSVIKMVNSTCIWKYADKMPSKYIQYHEIDCKLVLYCSKHRHVLIQLLDPKCNVLGYTLKNINDNKIVGIIKTKGQCIVGTFNCILYQINCVISGNNLNATVNTVDLKESYNEYYLNGFGASQNGVIWALSLSYNRIEPRKFEKKFEIAFLYAGDNDETEINLLLNNPTEKLLGMSDCLELLKFKSNKFKTLPNIDYHNLLAERNDNIYNLRIYLILLILYKNRIEYSHNKVKYDLPETSIEKIRDMIYMKHAVHLINNILKLHKKNGVLTESQKEVYFGCKLNIDCYCQKYDKSISEYVPKPLNIVNDNNYICQCCDEVLIGFDCKNNHLNQFCSVTFTLIVEEKYLICQSCSQTARYKLKSENTTCTLCDLPLCDYNYLS